MEETETTVTIAAARPRAHLSRARPANRSATTVAVALLAMVAFSTIVRVLLGRTVHGPFVFMDELAYERMAYSFAHTGHFSLFDGGNLASPLYPFVISPIYAFAPSAEAAYDWVKALNSLLISLSVVPMYCVARFVLPPARALGVAALSLLLPLMFYSDLALSENLAYPLVLVAFWAMLRTIRAPRAVNDVFLVAAVVLATLARLQNVVLLPAAMTAILLMPLVRPGSAQRPIRAAGGAILGHRTLFAGSALMLAFVLVKRAVNGGALPLAGIYANVGTVRVGPLRLFELAFQHLAELDLAVGVIPFACAMLGGYLVVRRGFPREQLAFAVVALSVTGWFLLEVAYAAATLDIPGSATATPRIHERYLIYTMPLFLIAFVAALRAAKSRVPLPMHFAVVAAAVLLPAAIPFDRVINNTVTVDSLGLQMLTTGVHGQAHPVPHAATVAVLLASVLALSYLYGFVRPHPSIAVLTTVTFFVMVSMLVGAVHANTHLTGETAAGARARSTWVDEAAKGRRVVLVGGPRNQRAALLLTAFDNLSITRVYATCNSVFGAGFGERRLRTTSSGSLVAGTAPVHARFVVAPADLEMRGRVVTRGPAGLELVIPRGGVLRVRPGATCVR